MSLEEKVSDLLDICRNKGLRIATAESCTGGLVSSAITDIPGSSDIFDRGFVTYSNQAKAEMLGVEAGLIESVGAVSEEVAVRMAEGAVKNSTAQLTVSVTGIAGPEGGTADKPVGLVYIASALAGSKTKCIKHVFQGDRRNIRQQATENAIILMLEQVGG